VRDDFVNRSVPLDVLLPANELSRIADCVLSRLYDASDVASLGEAYVFNTQRVNRSSFFSPSSSSLSPCFSFSVYLSLTTRTVFIARDRPTLPARIFRRAFK